MRQLANVVVGRYADPQAVGYLGWMEPEDRSWVIFVGLDNKPVVFLDRDQTTGEVL